LGHLMPLDLIIIVEIFIFEGLILWDHSHLLLGMTICLSEWRLC